LPPRTSTSPISEHPSPSHLYGRCYSGPKHTQLSNAFLIKHYAGDVSYDCRGMVEKNADRLSRNLYQLLSEAAEPRTRSLYPPKDEKTAGSKASTVGEKFRSQLTQLMTTVEGTTPFFIRCIKPNQQKAPNRLEMKGTIEQLTYAGVFEAVKIRKGGFPFRRSHAEFAQMYRWIARKAHGWVPINADPASSAAEYCHAVLGAVHQDFSQVGPRGVRWDVAGCGWMWRGVVGCGGVWWDLMASGGCASAARAIT
jgi:myosin heavy subunit